MSPLKYNCQCFLLLTFQMNLRVTCLTLTPVFPHDFLCQLAIVSDFKCQISVVSVHLSLTRAHVHVHSNCPGWLMQSIRAISLTVASSDRLQDLWDIGLLCQNRMNSLIFLLYFHLCSPPTSVHPWQGECECVVLSESKCQIIFDCYSVGLFHIVMDGWDQTGWKMDGGESHPPSLPS